MKKSKIMGISFGVAGAILALILIYFLSIYFFVFKANFHRLDEQRTPEQEIEFYAGEENYKIHLEDAKWAEENSELCLEITSFDGLKLKALLMEAEKDCQGTVLLMHGYHSGPIREFATISKVFHEMNYNVVMPYQRSHGESEGKWITFGIKERYDCRDWILKINELYGDGFPLFVGGISMGCATITMTSGFDLPSNVRGFIADCGFTSPYEITYWTATKKMGLPKTVATTFVNTTNWIGKTFFDYPLDGYSTYEALSKCNKPFLFISGTADETVPVEMTMSNYLQYKGTHPYDTELLLVEDCPHAISYLVDKENYDNKIRNFVQKYGAK